MYAAAAGGVGADMWRVYAAMATPNANPRGAAGATPLQAALNYQNRSVAELTAAAILSNDGNPNPEPNALPAPLLQAAGRGSRELTEMLIQYGAEPAVVDQRGRSATDLAAANKHTDVVRLLARQHEIPRACWSGRAAVDAYGQPYVVPPMRDIERVSLERIVSVSHRQVEAVRELIRSDPRLAHAAATTGERGVEAGAHMGNPEIVSTLLEAGAPYSLATAAMRNDLAHARALLNNDPARINERGAHGFPLLWYPVIGGGDRDMLQLLLDSGAHIEDHHFLGTTSLHLACRRGQAETVELLVENGADVNRRGRKFGGQPASPLEMAIASGEERVIGFLKSRGARD